MIHRSVLSVIVMTVATTLLFAISRDAHAQNVEAVASSVELVTDDIQKAIEISGDFEETLASDDGQVHLQGQHTQKVHGPYGHTANGNCSRKVHELCGLTTAIPL